MSRHRRGIKRPHPLLKDMDETAINISSDYVCSVCLDCLHEPYMTQCGHTFCKECITKCIQINHRCPKCTFIVNSIDSIFPNHMVSVQLRKYRRSMALAKSRQTNNKKRGFMEVSSYLASELVTFETDELARMIQLLQERKGALVAGSEYTKYKLLKVFLSQLDKNKDKELTAIEQESKVIKADLAKVLQRLNELEDPSQGSSKMDVVPNIPSVSVQEFDPEGSTEEIPKDNQDEGFNVPSKPTASSDPIGERSNRVQVNFSELSDYYFSVRVPRLCHPDEDTPDLFSKFGNCISKFTKFSKMRPLATIEAGDRNHTSSNIASSIEFDKDSEFFAVAGLTKKIRLFDYCNVIMNAVDVHYPCAEMLCDSKISCVCWSSYHKSLLASSDYDGTVTVWDSATAKKLHVYQEHQKRCWSVDFNKVDSKLIASGGDDSKIKIWNMDKDRSIYTLDADANVCCVQFSPTSRYHLAFGCADHGVHFYDLRNTKNALCVFKGHKKAVSYVKFISDNELISASTDSSLKLWNVNEPTCIRSFQGHTNEKNFVGLATDGNYIACGSENNSLYVYYKDIPKQLFSFKFDNRKLLIEPETQEDSTDFVSAVAWRQDSDVIAAGNSLGIIKILQMV